MWELWLLLVGRALAVVTCGGFVTASSSLIDVGGAKLDYSFVKMHLFTQEGLLKYSTECAPNGYYFIPVYDKGSFYLQIEGANGWAFEPEKAHFTVSDNEEGCSEDINFKFTGFAFTGLVTGEDPDCTPGGPSGVTITMTRDSKVVATTLTTAGRFTFPNVFPATYTVTASHPTWTMGVKEHEATVSWGNSELATPFTVIGYPIIGTISASAEPVSGVDVFLFSDKPRSLRCEKPVLDPPAHRGNLLCSARSNSTGSFSFADVPCGQYTLVPSYKRSSTTFDVSPRVLPITVVHGALSLGDAFQVMGFSVSGRVKTHTGVGLGHARILLNGEERTVTDANGHYQLDQVKSGKHTIEAQKEHMVIERLTNYLSPSHSEAPDMKVLKYALCGTVHSAEAQAHEVVLESGTRTSTDVAGKYCFQVEPGSHVVTPLLSASEQQRGVHMSPPSRTVVVDAPVLHVDFVQARITVSGVVKCVSQCGDVKVQLQSVEHPEDPFPVAMDASRFTFRDVYPGQYKLSIQREGWCWEQPSRDLAVDANNIDNLSFQQTGYVFQIDMSHSVKLRITMGSDFDQTFDVKQGPNQFCLPRAGTYRIQPISCFQFAQEFLTFDTASPRPLSLKATKFRVSGLLLVQQSAALGNVPSIPVHVRPANDQYTENVEQIQAVFKRTEQSSAVTKKCQETEQEPSRCNLGIPDQPLQVFEYTYWASPGDRFEIVPLTQPKALLFYPRSVEIALTSATCPPPAQPFLGRMGLFLKGRVTPAVADVRIVVEAASSGSASMTVTTSADGNYSAGPLYDDEEYTVSAFSEGYHFEESGGNFRALRLGQITVSTLMGTVPLEGVLLSLSGTNYRSNNETGPSGSFRFAGLFPGSYFVRPLLKEYNFSPNSKSIELPEAADLNVSFAATRIAYSVLGAVKSLSGEPEQGLIVEALQVLEPEDGKKTYPRHEETVTDVTGTYRLRGLLPNSTYTISVNAQNSAQAKVANRRIDKTSPPSKIVDIQQQDIAGVDFTSFRRLTKFDLTGTVEAEPDWLDTLEVILAKETTPKTVLKSVPISKRMTFFEFPALPEDDYVVYARTTLSQHTHSFLAPLQHVRLTDHFHVVATFQANVKTISQEPTHSSFTAGLFIAVMLLAAVKREQFMEVLERVTQKVLAKPASADSKTERKTKRPERKSKKSSRGTQDASGNESE